MTAKFSLTQQTVLIDVKTGKPTRDLLGLLNYLNTVSQELTSPTLPVALPSFTVLTVPAAASYTGNIIYVSNETSGATIAFSDGTNWRRAQDRAIIS